jgi:thiamine pyrophosphate-dependent acetolactate synthase large subunit-like protein
VLLAEAQDLSRRRLEQLLDGGPLVRRRREAAGEQRPQVPVSAEPSPELEPDDRSLDRLAEVMGAARRPLILAGRGAAEAHATLIALAERIGARLGTTALTKDQFLGHPHNLGVVGGFATDTAVEELAEIDCVLAFGASLNQFTLGERTLFRDAAIVQVDADASALGRLSPVTLAVHASAGAAAARLLDRLAPAERPALREIGRPTYNGPDAETGDRLDPRRATAEIAKLVPEPRTVVIDCGRFMGWPARFVPAGPNGFRMTAEFGAIGTGLGTALGVAAARPDRPTVLFVGDGGLSNLPGDLETAAHIEAPLLIVVLNDASYAAEFRIQRKRDLPTALSELRDVAFADVARAYGIEAATARSVEDLSALAPRLATLDSAFLIDCKIAELDADSWRTWSR